jgi:hypothetical protein
MRIRIQFFTLTVKNSSGSGSGSLSKTFSVKEFDEMYANWEQRFEVWKEANKENPDRNDKYSN